MKGWTALLVLLCGWSGAAAYDLAPFGRTRLDNGLTVMVVASDRVPLVHLALEVEVGSASDPEGREGLAGLTARLLTQASAERSAVEVSAAIEDVGGSFDAFAGTEATRLSVEVLAGDWPLALSILADAVRRPRFLEEDVARVRGEIAGGIESAADDPGELARRSVPSFLHGDSSYGHPVSGWLETIGPLGRDAVVAFHEREFRPDRAVLVVVGDVEEKALAEAVDAAFGDWKGLTAESVEEGASPAPAPATPPVSQRQARAPRVLVPMEGVTQAQIRVGCPAVSRSHPDYFALQVTNTILGGMFTSRLVDSIRVSQGLTYGISSRFGQGRQTGHFLIRTFTRNETLRRTLDETLRILGELVAEGPTEEELAKAKRYLTGQFPLELQAPADLAGQLLQIHRYRLPDDFLSSWDAKVRAVSMKDCRRVLQERYCGEEAGILIVADPEVAVPALEGLGEFEVAPPR